MTCPLCASHESTLYSADSFRSYFQCSSCNLVFVPRAELISEADEKKRYDSHENSSDDEGYRKYLGGILQQVLPFLSDKSTGLDYGSGRTELFASLFPSSYRVESFDLYYFPRTELFQNTYDFITLIEVIEHLRNPASELTKLKALLRPGGMLFFRTKFLPDKEKFKDWFYKRDVTHVQFFTPETVAFLCRAFGFREYKILDADLSVLINH